MTLDEAIKDSETISEECQRVIDTGIVFDLAEYQKTADNYRQLAEWLKDYKRLLEQTRWIPVSERLPDIHNYCMKCLVTDSHRHIHTSLFTESNGKGWWSYGDVIAWMPLPEPYKAGSEVQRDNK